MLTDYPAAVDAARAGAVGRPRFTPPRETLLLAAVALGYGLAQIGSWRLDLGWDETIYVSQVDPDVPTAFFSAPRARGVTLLAAPVASVTSDVTALRIWFTLLSAVALFCVFRLWFRVIAPAAAVVAGLLFACLWVAVYYGPQVMPNLWVAFSAVAAVAGLLRVTAGSERHDLDRTGLLALVLGAATMTLMRPSDAAWLSLPLVLGVLVVRSWRTWTAAAGLFGGLALGALPWVVEAYVRFGGMLERLHQASEIQGGTGFNPWLLRRTVQTLDGPLLCRPCAPDPVSPLHVWWVFVLPVAVLVGVFVAVRHGRTGAALLPTLAAASIALPYLFLLEYTAPRFLLPSYALAAVPSGLAAHHLLVRAGRWRPVAIGVVAALLVVHVASQGAVLRNRVDAAARNGNGYTAVAERLHALGIDGDCVVSGYRAAPIAFYARCRSRMVGGHDGSIDAAGLVALSRRQPTVVIVRGSRTPPPYAQSWAEHPLPRVGHTRLRAFVAPRS
ncbi:hypothetical protein ACIB24_16935 [Spongisporangium articulatum]|uniref:Glycosyltransferase RgtA/B/C/D-like domain-containing protein n=1 Tax=Spongisporangium articulatum TaxID=3362603 RepID=A0ABW8AS93_9ACTN